MTAWTQAAVDSLTAAGIKRAYPQGGVPASPAYAYVVVTVARVTPGAYALAGGHGVVTWRLTTQTFGRTAAEVEAVDALAFNALQDQQLLPRIECGPCSLQVSNASRDPDDAGVLGVTSSYLFTVTKEIP